MLIPGGSSGGIQDVYCQFTSLVSLLSKAVSVEIQCYSSSAILHRDREFLEDPTRIVDANSGMPSGKFPLQISRVQVASDLLKLVGNADLAFAVARCMRIRRSFDSPPERSAQYSAAHSRSARRAVAR